MIDPEPRPCDPPFTSRDQVGGYPPAEPLPLGLGGRSKNAQVFLICLPVLTPHAHVSGSNVFVEVIVNLFFKFSLFRPVRAQQALILCG